MGIHDHITKFNGHLMSASLNLKSNHLITVIRKMSENFVQIMSVSKRYRFSQ